MRMSPASLSRPSRREVVDVAERRPGDRRLDQLLHVRKQRLGRLERERNEAREQWRQQRRRFKSEKQRWRKLQDQALGQWAEARAAFSGMTITSGEFRRAKAIYERLKKEAAQLHVDCQQLARQCRTAGKRFFAARELVMQANRQQEKLGVMRDQLRAIEAALNAEA